MTSLIATLRRGLHFPPSGWALAGMLAFYVLAGLFGRDPWKGEDAIHIATAWHIVTVGDWLTPNLAGRFFDEPPLYYWVAAIFGKLLGWAMPLHDAIRLSSGAWVGLALVALYYAGRELYGQEKAAASPMLLAGCVGLVLTAHDAQPLLIGLAAYSTTLAAMAGFARKARVAGVFYGLALAACLLGVGIAATLPLLAGGLLAAWLLRHQARAWQGCLIGWALFALLAAPWLVALAWLDPARLLGWAAAEWKQLVSGLPLVRGLLGYLALLPTVAFPTLLIAGWTLWAYRKRLSQREIVLPLAFFGLTLLMLLAAYRPKELPTLLLLPAIALLATPGALSLRRGAASALDWFGVMTFTLFTALVWLGWSALHFGWPEHLAKRALHLRPGFVAQLNWLAFAIALAATIWWFWLIATSARRAPYRSIVHWSMGITTFWLLASLLWMPWFDYGRSYRPAAQALAKHLPEQPGCVAEKNLGDPERASLAYFTGIEPLPLNQGRNCRWLITMGRSNAELHPGDGWEKIWEGNRPGDRRDKLRLYRR